MLFKGAEVSELRELQWQMQMNIAKLMECLIIKTAFSEQFRVTRTQEFLNGFSTFLSRTPRQVCKGIQCVLYHSVSGLHV